MGQKESSGKKRKEECQWTGNNPVRHNIRFWFYYILKICDLPLRFVLVIYQNSKFAQYVGQETLQAALCDTFSALQIYIFTKLSSSQRILSS